MLNKKTSKRILRSNKKGIKSRKMSLIFLNEDYLNETTEMLVEVHARKRARRCLLKIRIEKRLAEFSNRFRNNSDEDFFTTDIVELLQEEEILTQQIIQIESELRKRRTKGE